MKIFAKRLGILGASVAAMAAIYVPSAQAATNPYTPQGACSNDFGGSWSSTTDGHRTVTTANGTKYGDVYLMYNSGTGRNCVVTLKTAYAGTSTGVGAGIQVQGTSSDGNWLEPNGDFKYYEAVQADARGKCVMYEGWVKNTSVNTSGVFAEGGRYTWGNCG